MTAREAATAIASGVERALPGASVELAPVSDGGPGFVDILAGSLGGEIIEVPARDPLLRPRTGVILSCGGSVYVETADSVGLELLAPGERDPLRATSAGVSDLLSFAGELAPERIVLGLGGSATNDGGAGMLQGAGLALLDATGRPIGPEPVSLSRLAHVRRDEPRGTGAELIAAVDVDNPLLGPEGATAVFAPQKGADEAAVARLEQLLARLVSVVSADLPETSGLEARPGSGSAGGLGYGLSLLGAATRRGADVVFEALGLEERIATSDLAITGEGSFDGQSLRGKAAGAVARLCLRTGVPCLVLAGRVGVAPALYRPLGVTAAHSLEEKAGTLAAAREGGAPLLAELASEVAAKWSALGSASPRDH